MRRSYGFLNVYAQPPFRCPKLAMETEEYMKSGHS